MALAQESEIALRAIPDMASRVRVGRRADVEVEEASILSWENSIQATVKEELFAVSPEVSVQFVLKQHLNQTGI